MKKRWKWLLGGAAIGIACMLYTYLSGITPYYDWATATDEMKGMNTGQALFFPLLGCLLGFIAGLVREGWAKADAAQGSD